MARRALLMCCGFPRRWRGRHATTGRWRSRPRRSSPRPPTPSRGSGCSAWRGARRASKDLAGRTRAKATCGRINPWGPCSVLSPRLGKARVCWERVSCWEPGGDGGACRGYRPWQHRERRPEAAAAPTGACRGRKGSDLDRQSCPLTHRGPEIARGLGSSSAPGGPQLCRAWSPPSGRAGSPGDCEAQREGLQAPVMGACPGHWARPGTHVRGLTGDSWGLPGERGPSRAGDQFGLGGRESLNRGPAAGEVVSQKRAGREGGGQPHTWRPWEASLPTGAAPRVSLSTAPLSQTKPRSVRAQAVGIGTRWPGCHSPMGSPARFPSMAYHFNLGIFHPGSTSLSLAQTPQDHHPLFLSWAIQSRPSRCRRRLHPTPYQPLHRGPVCCEQALSRPWPFAGLCPLPLPCTGLALP